MKLGVETTVLARKPQPLSTDHLGALAKTYDHVDDPVWVENLTGECLYQNHSARKLDGQNPPPTTFDILDHSGHIVARLMTLIH